MLGRACSLPSVAKTELGGRLIRLLAGALGGAFKDIFGLSSIVYGVLIC